MASQRATFRVICFSVQSDHLHLIVEGDSGAGARVALVPRLPGPEQSPTPTPKHEEANASTLDRAYKVAGVFLLLPPAVFFAVARVVRRLGR